MDQQSIVCRACNDWVFYSPSMPLSALTCPRCGERLLDESPQFRATSEAIREVPRGVMVAPAGWPALSRRVEPRGKPWRWILLAVGVVVALAVGARLVLFIAEKLREQSAENDLKQIGLAIQDYASDNQDRIVPAAITDGDGKPLLSWRVTLLPYLGETRLYEKFRLDEPWDSDHNKELLQEMPKVYAPITGKPMEPHTTYWRVFVGERTMYPTGGRNPYQCRYTIRNIPDGRSQTIAVVEAREAVPWTKPDELIYDPDRPIPQLGGQFGSWFPVLMLDGSVQWISKKVEEKTFREAIVPDDGPGARWGMW